jgi:hypothetical protein
LIDLHAAITPYVWMDSYLGYSVIGLGEKANKNNVYITGIIFIILKDRLKIKN